jgi:hypothetical protein
VLGQCGLHGIVDIVTGDKLGGRIVRQSHKIFCESLYLCGSFKVENVGSQFLSLRQLVVRRCSPPFRKVGFFYAFSYFASVRIRRGSL